MPAQAYKPENHTPNDDILHEAVKDYIESNPENGNQLSIGLPSLGDYSALVVPVQFANDKFTTDELADLATVFNGTEAQTGWNSVSTYSHVCWHRHFSAYS